MAHYIIGLQQATAWVYAKAKHTMFRSESKAVLDIE